MSDRFDQAAKFIGLIGIGLYAIGFAVVSINDGTYGFIAFSAFRAKVIAAGLMFAVLYFPALLNGARIYGRFGLPPKTPLGGAEDSLKRFASVRLFRLSELAISAWALAFFFQFLVVGYTFRFRTFGLFLGYILVKSLPNVWTQAFFEQRPGLYLSTVFLPDFIGIGAAAYLKWYSFIVFLAWFFVAGLDAQDMSDLFQGRIALREYNWHILTYSTFVLLVLFSVGIYPLLPPNLGGGHLTPIHFQFSPGAGIDKSLESNVLLVDEVEGGYYVVRTENDNSSVFIPRTVISLAYLGPNTLPATRK